MPIERLVRTLPRAGRNDDERPDGELVGRFLAARDEESFTELYRRHGPTIYGVCRRVLGRSSDADDAFQAVWIVFLRRTAAIRPPGSVGPFLYGVAVRTATKARIVAAKRELRERVSSPRAQRQPPDPELAAILDAEIADLPEKLRAAVVLCDVTGKSRSAAAADLGWPEGTVADRVRKGRELLAARLRNRGVALSLAGLTVAVPADVSAAVYDAALHGAPLSPSALALAEAIMTTTATTNWKLPLAALAACGLAAGVGFAERAEPHAPVAAATPLVAAPVPATPPKWIELPALDFVGWQPGSVSYSPDGTSFAVGGAGGHVAVYDAATRKPRWAAELDAKYSAVAYTCDGKHVAATFKDGVKFLDAATGKVFEEIIKKDSHPTVIATLADEANGADPTERRHKIAFDCETGTYILNWVRFSKIDGYVSAAGHDPTAPRRPLGEIALAADPAGHKVLSTSCVRDNSDKYELACRFAINKPNATGFDPRPNRAYVTLKSNGWEADPCTTYCAAWSGDGRTVVSGNDRHEVVLFDAETGKEKSRVRFPDRVAAVAVNSDGSSVAATTILTARRLGLGGTAYSEQVHIWDTKSPPQAPSALPMTKDSPRLGPPGGKFAGLASLHFSPDGKALTAAFANFDRDATSGEPRGTVRTWALR